MKRFITPIICLILALSLSACGSSSVGDSQSSQGKNDRVTMWFQKLQMILLRVKPCKKILIDLIRNIKVSILLKLTLFRGIIVAGVMRTK